MRTTLLTSVALAAIGTTALALGPSDLDGSQPDAATYATLVEEAMAATPPKNGESYVIGFANLGRNAPFFINTENGILANGEAAGVEVLVTDNSFDGSVALQNADSFVRRNVDAVIEFQTDANFAPTIMQKFDQAGIPVIAIDIPMPGATFFGANNPRSGFMGGSYLAQAAIEKWGAEAVANGYLVVGELPQSGAIPAMRTGGQIAGFQAGVEGFPEDHILRIDTKGTLEEAYRVTTDLLGRIPADAPIMGLAINDQSIMGMLRATTQAGRTDAMFVGMGADEIDSLVGEPAFVASVGYFPERYGNYLVPMALMALGGQELPPSVLMSHVMITPGNACETYTQVECVAGEEIDYTFPQDAFAAHLATLAEDPALADYQALIPSE